MGIPTIKKNFIVIILTLISTLIFCFASKWLLEIIMTYVERFINFVTYKFIVKLKYRYLLLFCEINMLIIPIVFLIILRECLGDFSLFVYFLLLFIWGSITFHVRKEKRNMFSLIDYIAARINSNNYFINRINLLFDQGFSVIILIGALEFTVLIFTQLEWPVILQYVAFLALPIYSNMWIYFSYKLKLKDDDTINIRRIIVYILLAIYVLGDSYSKVYSMLYYNTSSKLDLLSLFVYIASVCFIALERVIKSIIDDFKSFRQKAEINENN